MLKNSLLLVAAVATGLGLAVFAQPEAPTVPAPPQPAEAISTVTAPIVPPPAVAMAPLPENPVPMAVAQTTSSEAVASVSAASAHERLAALLQGGDSPALDGFGRETVVPEDAALLAELEAALLAEFEGS